MTIPQSERAYHDDLKKIIAYFIIVRPPVATDPAGQTHSIGCSRVCGDVMLIHKKSIKPNQRGTYTYQAGFVQAKRNARAGKALL